MERITSTDIIAGLLKSWPEKEWDGILELALGWNKRAYKLPEETVRSMFITLRDVQKSLNNSRPAKYAKLPGAGSGR